MNTISKYKRLEKIYEGQDTVVYRGQSTLDQTPVILKILKNEHPSLKEVINLKQEYEISKFLDLTGAIKAYELEKFENKLFLVLEDFGGKDLSEFLANESLNVKDVLNIGIQLADVLNQLHGNHIIHKDIKPQNIIIHPVTKQVKLSDFSIASRLNREHQAIANPNSLQGTLAYMSPEQTGRMNRAIDYRSDFYSLGVTFYQMLTGQLPFLTNDPLELIHAHIAKQPVPPHRVNPEIPEAVSNIVMKLLSKTAEERYQSAQGLKVDLEVCLNQLIYFGEITNFQAGNQDKSGRFFIPQKLYGREQEVEQLLSIFEKTCKGTVELVMVSGYSGIGKTSVINEIHKPIVQCRGYFIEGKFDPLQRNIPYTAIVKAFSDLVRQLLTETQARVEAWKEKLLEALGPNSQVIIELIPEVELIMGKQPPVPALPPMETQNRFNRVFQQFVQVFTQPEHPLVLFLDDLQWVDAASLKLLELLITDLDSQYLLALIAYRDNEVDATHPLMITVEELKKAGTVVHELTLQNLDKMHVQALVADTLREDKAKAKSLADLLCYKTQGNPFFLTQLFQSLYEDQLLIFDYNEGIWEWDLEQIQSRGITDLNVVELMTRNIQKLSPSTQEVLKVAACIGNRFTLDVLAIATDQLESTTATQLWKALQVGLILPISDGSRMALAMGARHSENQDLDAINPPEAHSYSQSSTYKFLHDRVQQAAYSLIPEEDRKLTHLKLGQQLLDKIGPDEIEANIFDIVNQLNRGVELLGKECLREDEFLQSEAIAPVELARLNLMAGHKAKEATAYETAAQYLTFGMELLAANSWEAEYHLSLDLQLEAAEAEYLNTNYPRATELTNSLLERGIELRDRVKVYELQIQLLIAQNQMVKAIDTGLTGIAELGVTLSEVPDAGQWAIELPTWTSLENLPKMTDPNKQAALRLLVAIIPAALISKPEIGPLIVFTQVNLCVQHGYSELSPYVYAIYGWLLCATLTNIEAGYAAGTMAIQLVDALNAKPIKCKVYNLFDEGIKPWKDPLMKNNTFFIEGLNQGLEVGDLEYSVYHIVAYCLKLLLSGQPLDLVKKEQEKYFKFALKVKQIYGINYLKIWKQFTHKITTDYLPTESNCLSGEEFNQIEMIQSLSDSDSKILLFNLYLANTHLVYLFNNPKQGVVYAELALAYQGSVMGMLVGAVHNFYYSLSLLAAYSLAAPEKHPEMLQQVENNQQQMQQWAKYAPDNFQHKYELVEAEKARVLGLVPEAMEWYDCAIASARDHEYLQEEAIANERAAEFYFNLGRSKIAQLYLIDAYAAYLRWGATAKVHQLELHYPHLLSPKRVRDPNSTESTHTTTSTTNLTTGALDLATVMKASQTLADEIIFDNLLEKLLEIVMESAGAQTGCFILEKGQKLYVEARGSVDPMQVILGLDTPFQNSNDVPVSLLTYVSRTRETLVLNQAAKRGRFIADPYLVKTQPKSLLCTPILNQGNLIGLLYLENNQTTNAFTEDRVEVLKMLCSQIAISIKNARLYGKLEATTTELISAKERLEESNHTLEEKVAQRTLELQAKNADLQQTLKKLRETQTQLIQTEKMSSLGQLVAGVAHEINNPVNFIYGNLIHGGEYLQDLLNLLELYEETYPEPTEDIEERVQEIELDFLKEDFPKILMSMQVGAERIRQIVRSLRNFSRLDEADLKEVDINEGIESTIEILRHRLKEKPGCRAIALEKNYGTLPLVTCYAGQLNQVFMNILSNAIDALEEKERKQSYGDLSVPINPDSLPVIGIRTSMEKDHLVIRITDNATGMTEEVLSKLFDPFFTTKPVGSGTGLGLSISYQIVVEKHGGHLDCRSTLGQGSEFAIAIPLKLSPQSLS
ncbi:AAA family ATPase [Laspinema sp. A4]|uniref:trifunctional serine/threonine-protein kinase/ATP-binding protein/sensor histidine kinase n=1 Tax=Laspinema sp. D2d TaxID=2953686 RepID=UPI0021BBAB20|nr:ATP-binding sensor histidine kinase [Laspinema sp. D2d]MCT7982346.1 AAA family ATPase [Laspinema sp. D2d]